MKKINLAVVGVTGMVGETILAVLEKYNLPIENYLFFASARSAGKKINFMDKEYIVKELNENIINENIDIALLAAGGTISEKYAPLLAANNCIVIDNSSAFRMETDVPLVVPEVNAEDIRNNKGIIANPNCSTIQAMVVLKPLHDKYDLKRVIYSTYQAVSGAGVKGYDDLKNGLEGKPPTNFPHPIANNCLPHIDSFTESGYTKEELKMIDETRKILHANDLKITATTVRVPVFDCHSESVNLEFNKPFELDELIKTLENSEGIVIEDDVSNNLYPMPVTAKGKDEVFVGRIRRDFSVENGVNLWIVADNIRKGAATNTVQIAKKVIEMFY